MVTAASLIKGAREQRGLTQQQLADQAGVTQSVISVYEAGRREPSLPTLELLLGAAGFDLDLRLTPTTTPVLSGPLGRTLRRRRRAVLRAGSEHGVTVLGVFGSVARGEEHDASDIDLLIDVDPEVGFFALGRARSAIEAIMGAQVDLVPERGLKPRVRREVERDLVAL